MTVRPLPLEVKRLVVRVFLDLGAPSRSIFALRETVLRNAGQPADRQYQVDGLRAVWQTTRGIVTFYDAEGVLLRTVNLLEETAPLAVAA